MTYGRLRWMYHAHREPVWHVLYGDQPVSWCSRRFVWHDLITHPAPSGRPCQQCAAALTSFGATGEVSAQLYQAVTG